MPDITGGAKVVRSVLTYHVIYGTIIGVLILIMLLMAFGVIKLGECTIRNIECKEEDDPEDPKGGKRIVCRDPDGKEVSSQDVEKSCTQTMKVFGRKVHTDTGVENVKIKETETKDCIVNESDCKDDFEPSPCDGSVSIEDPVKYEGFKERLDDLRLPSCVIQAINESCGKTPQKCCNKLSGFMPFSLYGGDCDSFASKELQYDGRKLRLIQWDANDKEQKYFVWIYLIDGVDHHFGKLTDEGKIEETSMPRKYDTRDNELLDKVKKLL